MIRGYQMPRSRPTSVSGAGDRTGWPGCPDHPALCRSRPKGAAGQTDDPAVRRRMIATPPSRIDPSSSRAIAVERSAPVFGVLAAWTPPTGVDPEVGLDVCLP